MSTDQTKNSGWDGGQALLLSLKSSPFFNYDSRDLFSIDDALTISEKLVDLDPTCMSSYSYVALLLKTALKRINISLFDAVMNQEFSMFANQIRAEHDVMTSRSHVMISEFTEKVQNSFEQATGARFKLFEEMPTAERTHKNISYDNITLLLKDALIATEMPVTWIYSDGSMIGYDPHIRLHSDIMLFPNMLRLEESIRQHELGYGLRYVTINSQSPTHAKIDLFVYCSPSHAFILGEFAWDRFNNQMKSAGGPGYQFKRDGLTYADQHFPTQDNANGLSVISNNGQVVGNIYSCDESVTIWLLMLTELFAIKLPKMEPTDCYSSAGLLQFKGVSMYPVVSELPYTLDELSLESVITKIGIYQSDYKKMLLELIEGITIDEELLPQDDRLYLHLVSMERFSEETRPSAYSKDSDNIIKLAPYPNHHFGLKAELDAEIERVACHNLLTIVNAKFLMLWEAEVEGHQRWFQAMAKKKAKHLKLNIPTWVSTVIESNDSQCEVRESFLTSMSTDHDPRYLAYRVDTPKKKELAVIKLPLGMAALYKSSPEKELLGYFSNEPHPEKVIMVFNSSEEIMKAFNCRRTSLPPLLQNWSRIRSQGQISYPWSDRSQSRLLYCTLSVYW